MARAAFPSGRKSLLLLALAAAIIGGAWWWQRPPREPVWNGQRLSGWIASHGEDPYLPNLGLQAFRDGIRGFGPAGITWLKYQSEYGTPGFAPDQPHPFDHAPLWVRHWLPERLGGLRPSPREDQRIVAAEALGRIGPEAAPAIPALIRDLERKPQELRGTAAVALQRIGPASWPTVHEILEHGDRQLRIILLRDMGYRTGNDFEPAADSDTALALAYLVKACRDADAEVRGAAVYGLGECRNNRSASAHLDAAIPDIAIVRSDTALFDATIPEIIRLLSDPDDGVRSDAAFAIGDYEEKGVPAIRRLIEMLDDHERSVRVAAALALSRVDQSEKRSAARLRIMFRDDPDHDCRAFAAETLQEFGLSLDDKSESTEALPGQ